MALGDTNTIGLDDGHCGRNLRIGVQNFCPVNEGFIALLYGDGGMPTYKPIWDGVELAETVGGTSHFVCLKAPATLSEGPHTVSARELTPNAGKAVTPFTFVVDTHVPAAPVITGIATWSDSGLLGDHITKYRNPSLEGTAEKLPLSSIQLYVGPTMYGGAAVQADGSWRVAMNYLQDGIYDVVARQQTRSGNKSPISAPFRVIIAQADTPPAPAPLPGAPAAAAVRADKITWTAPAGTVTGYGVYQGPLGSETTLVAEVGGTVTEYLIPKAQGGMFYRVRAQNASGWGPYSGSV